MAAPISNLIGSLNTSIGDDVTTDGTYIYAIRSWSTSRYLRVYFGLTYLAEVLLPHTASYGLLCKNGCIIVGVGKPSTTTFKIQAYSYNPSTVALDLIDTLTCGPLPGYSGTGNVVRMCDGSGSYFFAALKNSGIGVFTFNGTTLSYVSYNYGDVTWYCDGVAFDGTYVYGVFQGEGLAAYSFSSGTLTFIKRNYIAYAGYSGDYNNVIYGDSAGCFAVSVDTTNSYIFVGANYMSPHLHSNAVWAVTFDGSNFNVIDQWIQDPTASYNSNYMYGLAAGKGCFYTTGRPLSIVYFDGSSFTTLESINVNADGKAVAYGNNKAVLYDISTDMMYLYEVVTVSAYFNSSVTSGYADLNVQFIDMSIGFPDTYLWNFGDGSTSTVKDPQHIYTVAGTYTVTLTVYKGVDSSTTIGSIIVYVNTIASILPAIGFAPLTVNCMDMSTGFPDAREWDFGDGSVHSYVTNTTHIYNNADDYTVTLITYKGTSSYSTVKTISVNILASATADTYSGVAALSVQFADASTGNPDVWLWNFDDGSTSTDKNPYHTFTYSGTYNVTLTVSNTSTGKIGYTAIEITATMNVSFDARPVYGYLPLVTYFTDNTYSSSTIVSRLWNFGDGTTSSDVNPIHTYSNEGNYDVSLTINNGYTTETTVKHNLIVVTSLKSEMISNIKYCANNYGTSEVISCLGTNGTEWSIGATYSFMETLITGVCLAIINRSISRGEPFYGSLYKSVLEFSDENKITLNQVYGLLIGDSLEISLSEFNSGGKTVAEISKYTSDKYVISSQLVNDETGMFNADVQPPDEDLSIENTVDRVQACINDALPIDSTEDKCGIVKCSPQVTKIVSPINNRENRVNLLIDLLIEAGIFC